MSISEWTNYLPAAGSMSGPYLAEEDCPETEKRTCSSTFGLELQAAATGMTKAPESMPHCSDANRGATIH